jgi:hypothetical protein
VLPWLNSRVRWRWMDGGEWTVTRTDAGWCELKPESHRAHELALLGEHGRVWIRKRDLTRTITLQETLL